MFLFHIAFALGLMAMAAGAKLYMKARCKEVAVSGAATVSGSCLGRFIGFIVILFATLSTVCTAYCGYKCYQAGYFPCPMTANEKMMGKEMENKDMAGMVTVKEKASKTEVSSKEESKSEKSSKK